MNAVKAKVRLGARTGVGAPGVGKTNGKSKRTTSSRVGRGAIAGNSAMNPFKKAYC